MLMLGGCTQPDYVSEELKEVSDDLTILGSVDEPQGNEQDFLFNNYDVKDVEHPADESFPNYDFSGPDNGGITYEPTGYVEDPISSKDSINPDAPKIYLCPGHNKRANIVNYIASSEDDEAIVKKYLQSLNTDYKKVSSSSNDTRLLKDKSNNKSSKYSSLGDALKDFMSVSDNDIPQRRVQRTRKKWLNDKIIVPAYTNGTQAGGLKEYEECFKIANYLKTGLEAYGCPVVLCKSQISTNIHDKKRASEADKEGCTLIIELHECGETGKCQVFYANAGVDSKAGTLAGKITDSLKADFTCMSKKSLKNTMGKVKAGYPLEGWAEMPAVRVDFGKLEDGYSSHNEKFAEAVAKGVAETYGLESGT